MQEQHVTFDEQTVLDVIATLDELCQQLEVLATTLGDIVTMLKEERE